MGCVAEDASLVKWLLDIGSDFHRRCYGNFFCCDDQKVHRMDNLLHEEVDIPLKTNYLGYVSWGEYAHNFAAVLNQEEIFRLILAKGGNCDLQDTNGCSASHIMVVYDNIKMFDLVVEVSSASDFRTSSTDELYLVWSRHQLDKQSGPDPADPGGLPGQDGHVLPHRQH